MKCPICGSTALKTTNSRSTRQNTQTWRRKQCQNCQNILTTYEKPDMAWLSIKSTPKAHHTPYRRFLLTKSVLDAFDSKNLLEVDIESLVDSIEIKIINAHKTIISRQELIALVLQTLKPVSMSAYMRYLGSHTHPHNQRELARMIKELG